MLLSSADIFQYESFQISISGVLSVLNPLDPDQYRHSVGPDLGPNCFHRLSAEDESHRLTGKESNLHIRMKQNLIVTSITTHTHTHDQTD